MRKLFFALLTLLLSFSSTSHAFGRKYSQMQIAPDSFIVTIQGTKSTTLDQALSGLMTRASEITLKNNCKYFVVTSNIDHTTISKGRYSTIKKIDMCITIKCFKEQPKDDAVAVDADFFLKNKDSNH